MTDPRLSVPSFPAGPLVDLLEWAVRAHRLSTKPEHDARFQAVTGVSVRTYQRMRSGTQRTVRGVTVDEVCIRLGLHPALIYPEWSTTRIWPGDPLDGVPALPRRREPTPSRTH